MNTARDRFEMAREALRIATAHLSEDEFAAQVDQIIADVRADRVAGKPVPHWFVYSDGTHQSHHILMKLNKVGDWTIEPYDETAA